MRSVAPLPYTRQTWLRKQFSSCIAATVRFLRSQSTSGIRYSASGESDHSLPDGAPAYRASEPGWCDTSLPHVSMPPADSRRHQRHSTDSNLGYEYGLPYTGPAPVPTRAPSRAPTPVRSSDSCGGEAPCQPANSGRDGSGRRSSAQLQQQGCSNTSARHNGGSAASTGAVLATRHSYSGAAEAAPAAGGQKTTHSLSGYDGVGRTYSVQGPLPPLPRPGQLQASHSMRVGGRWGGSASSSGLADEGAAPLPASAGMQQQRLQQQHSGHQAPTNSRKPRSRTSSAPGNTAWFGGAEGFSSGQGMVMDSHVTWQVRPHARALPLQPERQQRLGRSSAPQLELPPPLQLGASPATPQHRVPATAPTSNDDDEFTFTPPQPRELLASPARLPSGANGGRFVRRALKAATEGAHDEPITPPQPRRLMFTSGV